MAETTFNLCAGESRQGRRLEASISADGKMAYVIYGNGEILAELFALELDKLRSFDTIRKREDRVRDVESVCDGHGDNEFKHFSLLEDIQDTCRISLYNAKFEVMNTRVFTDYLEGSKSFRGGYFNDSSKFTSISYRTGNENNTHQESVIRILAIPTFKELTEIIVEGEVLSTRLATLYPKTEGTGGGSKITFLFSVTKITKDKPEYRFQVYRVKIDATSLTLTEKFDTKPEFSILSVNRGSEFLCMIGAEALPGKAPLLHRNFSRRDQLQFYQFEYKADGPIMTPMFSRSFGYHTFAPSMLETGLGFLSQSQSNLSSGEIGQFYRLQGNNIAPIGFGIPLPPQSRCLLLPEEKGLLVVGNYLLDCPNIRLYRPENDTRPNELDDLVEDRSDDLSMFVNAVPKSLSAPTPVDLPFPVFAPFSAAPVQSYSRTDTAIEVPDRRSVETYQAHRPKKDPFEDDSVAKMISGPRNPFTPSSKTDRVERVERSMERTTERTTEQRHPRNSRESKERKSHGKGHEKKPERSERLERVETLNGRHTEKTDKAEKPERSGRSKPPRSIPKDQLANNGIIELDD